MGIVSLLAVVVLGGLVVWKIGSVALRVLGVILFGLGMFSLAVPGGVPVFGALVIALIGAVMWLAGHWLFALRHHAYRSPLAQRIFLTMLPSWCDPTRNWGVRTVDSGPS